MRISGGDSYWAEEIVQRTFVRLWEIHDQVSPDKSLISYLCTIAKNLLMKIFVLSKRKHFTNKEIAVELNISESTVATQLSLALKFMRDKLMAHYDELLPLVIYAALIKIV